MYGVKEEGITCFSCHCWTGAYLSNLSSNLGRLVLNAGLLTYSEPTSKMAFRAFSPPLSLVTPTIRKKGT